MSAGEPVCKRCGATLGRALPPASACDGCIRALARTLALASTGQPIESGTGYRAFAWYANALTTRDERKRCLSADAFPGTSRATWYRVARLAEAGAWAEWSARENAREVT
jgi:hypothetical protein